MFKTTAVFLEMDVIRKLYDKCVFIPSSLAHTPTTHCLRRTTDTVTWAFRSRTWAAAEWSGTLCGGHIFLWGQYSPMHHPAALSWRSCRAAEEAQGHWVAERIWTVKIMKLQSRISSPKFFTSIINWLLSIFTVATWINISQKKSVNL